MFTKFKFQIALKILRFVARFCPYAFKHLDFDYLRDEETNMRIRFRSRKVMMDGIEYSFDLNINGRKITTSIMVGDLEWEYFRDHPDFLKHVVMGKLHDMIYSHVIEPMLDKKQLEKLLRRPS